FQQGNVGTLPFTDGEFDIVLSLNGFHAFPDKEAAYREVFRVLRPGGTFCGCFYVADEHKRTDWFVRHIYEKAGFFTPPYETVSSLKKRLEQMYTAVTLENVKGIAWFVCRKEAKTETENEEQKETKA
ncbi:MAG: class I SAM-dependent methyltransferase, partial [Gemmiger qucibialis]